MPVSRVRRADADYTPLNEAFTKIKAISALIDNRKDDNVKFQEVVRVHSLLEPKVSRRFACYSLFDSFSTRFRLSFSRFLRLVCGGLTSHRCRI